MNEFLDTISQPACIIPVVIVLVALITSPGRRRYSPTSDLDYERDMRQSRLEHNVERALGIEDPREIDGMLLRLPEDERHGVLSALRSRRSDFGYGDSISDHLKKATYQDYENWLNGYLSKGGKVTHRYDYKLPSNFFVARCDFTLMPFYGAQSISVIVPEGINVELANPGAMSAGLGHNKLFFMKDFTTMGGTVPSYQKG